MSVQSHCYCILIAAALEYMTLRQPMYFSFFVAPTLNLYRGLSATLNNSKFDSHAIDSDENQFYCICTVARTDLASPPKFYILLCFFLQYIQLNNVLLPPGSRTLPDFHQLESKMDSVCRNPLYSRMTGLEYMYNFRMQRKIDFSNKRTLYRLADTFIVFSSQNLVRSSSKTFVSS